MIFVDTGALYACAIPDDPNHGIAKAWYSSNTQPLVITDYVIDETLTLFKKRREYQRGLRLRQQLLDEKIARIEWVLAEDFYRAWITFSSRPTAGWSFTDCVSRSVIERLGIDTAFAFDEHFREFGSLMVVPT